MAVTRNDGKTLYVVMGCDRNHRKFTRDLVWAKTRDRAISRAREMPWPPWVSLKTLRASICDPGTDELFAWARRSGWLVAVKD